MQELRRLLVGDEQKRLGVIEKRLDSIRVEAQQVSDVLAEAIALGIQKDGKLAQALSPVLCDSLGIAARQDPRPLAAAVSPILGPAVRGSISHALTGTIQSISKALETGLSPQALKWRLEAFRAGKPFAEVARGHSLAYRVEQVFLIHKSSGMLLQHAVSPDGISGDAILGDAILGDAISGDAPSGPRTLANREEIVKESLRAAREGSIREFNAGELKIVVQSGPDAILAAAVRGTPPVELRGWLGEALEAIHAERRDALQRFAGDAAPFDGCQPALQSCLRQALKPGGGASSGKRIGPVALAAAGLIVVVWAFFAWRSSSRWNALFDELRSTPGIQLTEVNRQSGKYRLRGLRDPLSADPLSIAARRELPASEIELQLEPYCSLAPELVLARARSTLKPPTGVEIQLKNGALNISGLAPASWISRAETLAATVPGVNEVQSAALGAVSRDPELLARAKVVLRPPATVELSVKDGALSASGSAPHEWISGAERLVSLIPGAKGFERASLVDLDERRMKELKGSLEALRFSYQGGTADLTAESKELLTPAVLGLDQIARTARTLGREIKISVSATREPESPESAPRGLEKLRAEALARALGAGGIDASLLSAEITGSGDPPADLQPASASLRIAIEPWS